MLKGVFHISENKADTRDLFRFLYNLLQNCRKHIGILSHASATISNGEISYLGPYDMHFRRHL